MGICKANILPATLRRRQRAAQRYTVAAMVKAGFWPHTISTDWNTDAHETGVIDLPDCMSKLFTYGMTLDQAIARVTIKAARTFAFLNDRGALHVAAITDLALLELREGNL